MPPRHTHWSMAALVALVACAVLGVLTIQGTSLQEGIFAALSSHPGSGDVGIALPVYEDGKDKHGGDKTTRAQLAVATLAPDQSKIKALMNSLPELFINGLTLKATSDSQQIEDSGKKLRHLPDGRIILIAKSEMKIGDVAMAEVRVGVGVPDNQMRAELPLSTQLTEGALKVSSQMLAKLTGAGFKIEPQSPEQQSVAKGFPTVWTWTIEAQHEGRQELTATLYALDPGKKQPQWLGSAQKQITVLVRPQSFMEWLGSLSMAVKLIAGIVTGIAAIVGVWFKFWRKPKKKPAPRRGKKKGK